MLVPPIQTNRLIIRPFVLDDLQGIHRILDVELGEAGVSGDSQALEARRSWLEWTIAGYQQLHQLFQPPYGDRAVTLKSDGSLIGAAGYVPCLAPFSQLLSFGGFGPGQLYKPEVGLFYAIAPAYQGQGFATKAAQALVNYGFTDLKLKLIVATTNLDNQASIAVMRHLGMRIETNPYPEPEWMQVVGMIENREGKMKDKELQDLLHQLNHELEHASNLDEDDRLMLVHLRNDIQNHLDAEGEGAPADESTNERISDAIKRFEFTHPTLTIALEQVLERLSGAGI